MSLPTKFEDLTVEALRRSALEDFAVGVEPKDNKKSVIAALVESGVTWADYVKMHPEVAPEKEATPQKEKFSTSREVKSPVRVRTAEPVSYEAGDRLLVKMERENPVFEVQGYRFTSNHPYALMTPEAAESLMRSEPGFRQALPSELADFYS